MFHIIFGSGVTTNVLGLDSKFSVGIPCECLLKLCLLLSGDEVGLGEAILVTSHLTRDRIGFKMIILELVQPPISFQDGISDIKTQ